jgi:hypothetical protein
MGRVDPEHDRVLALVGRLELGEERGVGAGVDNLEGEVERLDPLLVEAAPGDRAAEIAAVGERVRGGEGLGAGGLEQRPVSPRLTTWPVAVASSMAPRPVVSQISMATCRSPVFRPANWAR